MNLAIIPARGGSKRIPRKNVKNFCGKPIIAWSIEAALKSKCFQKVIVSTDDQEVAEIAKRYGAEVPFMRPPELSDDMTPTRPVINHAINEITKLNFTIEYVCCLYATAPFIQVEDLLKGHDILKTGKSDFAIPLTQFDFPIQRSVKINTEGKIQPMFPDKMNSRSQDLEAAYHDAGQFYWGKKEAFLSHKSVFGPDTLPIILPSYRVQDIDNMDDWVRAEIMFKNLKL